MAKDSNVSAVRKAKNGTPLTIFFTLLSIVWVSPIFIVLINSFKKKTFINKEPFKLASSVGSKGGSALEQFFFTSKKSFVHWDNYIGGIEKIDFFKAFGYSLFITVASVLVIIICTSMCGWYITRVKTKFTAGVYYLCVFSMVVPFQMVMFSLSKVADMLGFDNPLGIILVYLGFGAGLAVFMFCGFVKAIPLEIEEAAMIDGCNPIQTFFKIVLPILKPTCITVAILQAMWIWNDYLLPYLVLDIKKYKTIPIAIQYLKGGYGSVDMGAMMAMLVLAIIPIIIFYAVCQKYIIEGVVAGAVKG